MRLITFTWIVFALAFAANVYVVTHQGSYEQSIVGSWEEVSWEFEKADQPADASLLLSGDQKTEICKNLTIHQAERWEFKPDRHILLYTNDKLPIKHLEWNIKGRGNILEIRHSDSEAEKYQIQEIGEDTMVIHFNFDLQVRGIVKMTFKRIKNDENKEYAAKIP